MTKNRQIEILCETVDRLDTENRQLKKEKQTIDAELRDARKNAIFWQKQALRLMGSHPAVLEIKALVAAGAVPVPKKKEKSRLFTMD